MTREEILEMPAGYEINKLVAINVMGWALVNNHGDAGGKFWIGHGGSFGDIPERYLPDFSGEIAPAFSIVEKLMHEGFKQKQSGCESCGNLIYSFSFAKDDDGYEEYFKEYDSGITENNLPLAICHAALLAVMDIAPSP